jgi:lipopolysaccharide export LptBFGC system permease protein LptF
MIFTKYFLRRFVVYFISVNLVLAAVFNGIEFLEKLVRFNCSGTKIILKFIALNFLPTAFQLVPISIWLASILILREFCQQNEWETISLINIGYHALFDLFLVAGFIVTVASFMVNENFILQFSALTNKFKMESFKNQSAKILINKWYVIDNNLFCHFDFADLNKHIGQNLHLIFMDKNFVFKKIVNCSQFTINSKNKELEISEGKEFDINLGRCNSIKNQTFFLPSFFICIRTDGETRPLLGFLMELVRNWAILLKDTKREILAQILQRISIYFQMLIYPILTFSLFVLFYRHRYYRWLFAILPYPLITLIALLDSFLHQQSIHPAIALVPYFAIGILLLGFRVKIREFD